MFTLQHMNDNLTVEQVNNELLKLADDFRRHNHNTLNSDKVKQRGFINWTTIGGGIAFVATKPCIIKRISEVHAVTATGATVVEKLTGTQGVGSGENILNSDFSLASARDTVVNGNLTNKSGIPLDVGDRLSTYVSGSSSGISYQCITFEIEF